MQIKSSPTPRPAAYRGSAPFVGLAAAVVTSLGCAAEEAPTTAATVSVPVEIEVALFGPIVDELTLNGEVEAATDTMMAAGALGGHVEAVLVQEGQQVSAAQLLARVGTAIASAQHKQAAAAHRGAKSAHDRMQALAKQQLASRASLDMVEVRLAQAEGALAAAAAGRRHAYITAPHAGVVAKIFVDPGEHAGPGMPVLRLVDLSRVKVVAQVPERDAPRIAVGGEVRLSIGALDEEHRHLTAIVSRVGVAAKKYSRTFDVEVMVDNNEETTGGVLKPGMMARLSLVRGRLPRVLHIRRDAVSESLSGPRVFVVGETVAAPDRVGAKATAALLVRAVKVTLGPVQGNRVAVLKGLNDGDRVVVVGQRRLVDKQPVRIVSGGSPGAVHAEAPAAESPAAESPAAESPTAESPAAELPAAESPEAESGEEARP